MLRGYWAVYPFGVELCSVWCRTMLFWVQNYARATRRECLDGHFWAKTGVAVCLDWYCKDTKKFWNFQIVSTKNSTFGYKKCTFWSLWCFLGECRITKVFQAIFVTYFKGIKPSQYHSITVSQFYYEAYFCADASEDSKNVSKNFYYYIYNIYILYINSKF